ncbi:hypothetical protein GCM10027059_36520 [Myceligenerans halotolerans]
MSDDGATLALAEALSAAAPETRGAALLHARGEAPDLGAAAALPLARVAVAALDELRARVGPVLATVMTCPGCSASLDVPLMLDLLADTASAAATDEVRVTGGVVRAPTTADLLAAATSTDPAAALRDRCVHWEPGAVVDDPGTLMEVEAAAERLVGAADTTARLHCPACGAEAGVAVDLVALLTDHLVDEAQHVIAVVTELAAAYGWTEAEILSLPESRRAAYLEHARSGVRR